MPFPPQPSISLPKALVKINPLNCICQVFCYSDDACNQHDWHCLKGRDALLMSYVRSRFPIVIQEHEDHAYGTFNKLSLFTLL